MTKFRWLLIVLAIPLGAWVGYLLQPTEIIDVHYKAENDSYFAIVKHFPVTDQGKIQWWEKNKNFMEHKYHLPIHSRKFSIGFWIADYKIDSGTDRDSDLLCFQDMNSKENCIEKGNQPLKIWYREGTGETIYLLDNWKVKYIKDNNTGSINKVR